MASAYPIPGPSTGSDSDDSNIQEAAPDAKMLSPVQEVWAKHHTDNSPSTLTYEKSFKTQALNISCWRTTNEEKIVLGGGLRHDYDLPPCLTVLSADGTEAVYGLTKGRGGVLSGISLTNEKHAVVVDCKHVYTVNITDDTPPGAQLHPVNELDVKDPQWVFPRSKLEYGLLCAKPRRVEFFSLKNLLMDLGSTNSGFIHLDMPNPANYADQACFTRDGVICVSSYLDDVVYMYNTDGQRLDVIGTQREKTAIVNAGLLYNPRSIQCCGDVIIVSCRQGDVHAYESGTWRLLIRKGNSDSGKLSSMFTVRKFQCAVLGENRFWAIQSATEKNFKKAKYEDHHIVHLYRF